MKKLFTLVAIIGMVGCSVQPQNEQYPQDFENYEEGESASMNGGEPPIDMIVEISEKNLAIGPGDLSYDITDATNETQWCLSYGVDDMNAHSYESRLILETADRKNFTKHEVREMAIASKGQEEYLRAIPNDCVPIVDLTGKRKAYKVILKEMTEQIKLLIDFRKETLQVIQQH